jgi:hypothetical protein
MYDILSLTNSTLLTADMILLCTKTLYPNHCSHSPCHRKMCILLLIWCHCPPIWPPALPLNLTFIWIFPLKLSLWSPPYTNSLCTMFQTHVHIPLLRSFIQRIHPGLRIFNKLVFYGKGVVNSMPNPKAGGPPLAVCLQLLIQYIRSYPSLLGSVPPSTTWECAMLWWQRDPPNTVPSASYSCKLLLLGPSTW